MQSLSFLKPNHKSLSNVISRQKGVQFSYPEIGATATQTPNGYVVDHTRVSLGHGKPVFQSAKQALKRWQHMRLGWVDVWSPDNELHVGQDVAIMGWAMGAWWTNVCRIVYTVDEVGDVVQFGFANGTLPGHIAKGEERFLLQWDQATDEVHYDILAFSKPNRLFIKLVYPIVRSHQKRFGQQSAAAMIKAAAEGTCHETNASVCM